MLSELALVDWVALLIALILLGVAGVATYLSHESQGSRGIDGGPYTPNHALSGVVDDSVFGDIALPAMAMHAASSDDSVFTNAAPSEQSESPEPAEPDEVVLPDAPAPPILVGQIPTIEQAGLETIDLRDVRAETVAQRASRLRTRPIAETEAPVAVPIEATRKAVKVGDGGELFFANATNKLSVGMEPAGGFAKREPGFFSDPVGRHELRYWNGNSWTEYVKEGSDRFIDPL